MGKIVFATGNGGKLAELKKLVQDRPWTIFSLQDFPYLAEVEETGTTFQENARIKAVSASRKTGLIGLADDSGLEVDYLGGLPGVYSARFAGEGRDGAKNNEKLLAMLNGVPEEKRTARFRCAIALAKPDGEVFFCEGVCEGMIGNTPVGTGGFGYDPLFILPRVGKTMAQLNLEEKNLISHRGKAFRAVLPLLDELLSSEV